MILAVVQERDAEAAVAVLREHNFGVTQIASTGGFLRDGNVTLLIGVPERRVEEAVDLLRGECHRRTEFRATALPTGTGFAPPAGYFEYEVGGAVVFVLSVERLERA
jgi:uncharacterized protein YaaQ